MVRRRRQTASFIAAVIAALLVAGVAPASTAAPNDLASRRREAARLQARLEAEGERLSMADEQYNQARLERQRLESQLARVRGEVSLAEGRWKQLKMRLGERVRVLYKHPGAWADTLLGARSLSDLSRARALAGDVLLADTDLLIATERARAEMEEKAGTLLALRSTARAKEEQLAGRRETVQEALDAQRQLLAGVRSDIREIVEVEQRRQQQVAARRVEEAPRRAVAEAASVATAANPPARSAPASGGGSSTPPPTKKPSSDADSGVSGPAPRVHPSAGKAVQTAREQIGKPYRWGAEGPDAYDCSGLTKYAWASAGVSLPHSSQAQYNSLPKVGKDQIQPGDLLFFGNPIHHVGIYEGNGVMIEAPYSGTEVRRRSIHRSDYRGAARPS